MAGLCLFVQQQQLQMPACDWVMPTLLHWHECAQKRCFSQPHRRCPLRRLCCDRFALLSKIRVAKNFTNLQGRRQLVQQRLLAFNLLLLCHTATGEACT